MPEPQIEFGAEADKINLNHLLSMKLDRIDTLGRLERISNLQSILITTYNLTEVELPEWPTMQEVKDEWQAQNGTTVQIHMLQRRAAKSGEFKDIRYEIYERKLWESTTKAISKLAIDGYIGFEMLEAAQKFVPQGY